MNVLFSCIFIFLWANNFHIRNTAIEMKLNGVMSKKNEGFPELSRNMLKECQIYLYRNFSLCCTKHCLQVMSSELFSWQVICWTATMSSIIACTFWWWNISTFFEKKYGFLLCRERQRFLNFSVWGRNLGILKAHLRASVTPDCVCLPLLPGGEWQMGQSREQTAGKYLTSASDVEKKDGGNDKSCSWKGPSRIPTRWHNSGITQLTFNLTVPGGPYSCDLWSLVCCLMWWSVARWYLGNTNIWRKEKKR